MYCHLLEIRNTPQKGRGFFAKEAMSPGTTILKVHKDKFITYSLFADQPAFQIFMDKTGEKIAEFAFFLAYLSKEQEQDLLFPHVRNYQKNLPIYYHNLICWSEIQLKKLDNEELISKIVDKK